MFWSQGAARKCVSIACPPRRKARKAWGPDGDHQRQARSAPHRIAPADQSSKPKTRSGREPKAPVRPDRSTVPRTARPDRQPSGPSRLGRAGVRHRLDRGEGL